METISIKLGKKKQQFGVSLTISGLTVTNPDTHGIVLSMYKSKYIGEWCIGYRVREIDFFEEELVSMAVKVAKKNKW